MKLNIIFIKKQVIHLFAAIMMVFASCTADWLVPDPLSFYTPENAFTDATALYSALSACDRNLRLEYHGDNMPLVTEYIFSDVAVYGVTDKAPPAQNLNLQIVPTAELNNGDYNKIGWYWIQGYNAIKFASAVITRIDDVPFKNEAERNAVLSAALFHRPVESFDKAIDAISKVKTTLM